MHVAGITVGKELRQVAAAPVAKGQRLTVNLIAANHVGQLREGATPELHQ
jgi:predicted thioesterase